MIEPTIGRVVWYRERAGAKEQVAFVCDVHTPRLVSLFVIGHEGQFCSRLCVVLLQDGDEMPDPRFCGITEFCEWMPFQKGQAAKTDQVRDALEVRITTLIGSLRDDVAKLRDLLNTDPLGVAAAIGDLRKDIAEVRDILTTGL